jgi:hypothetical protein
MSSLYIEFLNLRKVCGPIVGTSNFTNICDHSDLVSLGMFSSNRRFKWITQIVISSFWIRSNVQLLAKSKENNYILPIHAFSIDEDQLNIILAKIDNMLNVWFESLFLSNQQKYKISICNRLDAT